MSKVFLSYSHVDEDKVVELYNRLTRDDVTCFFDRESIAWGQNFVLALEDGLSTSEYVIVCLSPAYCESDWGTIERTSFMAADKKRLKSKILPLILKPLANRDLIPTFLRSIQTIDISTPERLEKEYPRICYQFGVEPARPEKAEDRSRLPDHMKLPNPHWMPYRSMGRNFIGKVEELWQLHDMLKNRGTAVVEGVGVVMGTGGIGKTQLAIEYVHRFGGYYPGGVFWIDAEQGFPSVPEQIKKGIAIETDPNLRDEDRLQQVWNSISTRGSVLIVYDNFPEKIPLRPWLPSSGNIHCLVTTRRRDLEYARLPLRVLGKKDGIALLNSGIRRFNEEADKTGDLVEIRGGLPQALELARNFLNMRGDLKIVDLCAEIEKQGGCTACEVFANEYGDELPSKHRKSIAATFKLSYDLASETGKKILHAMAIMAPYPVPKRLLRDILEMPASGGINDPFEEAIVELSRKLSLVDLDTDNDPVMHRLMLAFVNGVAREAGDEYKEMIEKIGAVGLKEMSRVWDEKDVKAYRELEKVVPHAREVAELGETDRAIAASILSAVELFYKISARYSEAEMPYRRSLEIVETNFGIDHPNAGSCLNNFALLLKTQGKYSEAEPLYRRALKINEANFGANHPEVATEVNNLATLLYAQGKVSEAEPLLHRALKIDETHFGTNHPVVAIDLSNLANLLQNQGKYSEAEPMLRCALKIDEAHFGPNHPNVARDLNNLATLFHEQDNYSEAEPLYRRALKIDETHFGANHPAVATDLNNLALLLKAQHKFSEAEPMYRQSLAIGEATLGPNHPDVAIRLNNLATLIEAQGKYSEATSMYRRALTIYEAKLDPNHPKTKTARSNLQALLKKKK